MDNFISIGTEMVEIIYRSEEGAKIPWETLTKENALDTAIQAANLFKTEAVGLVRTTAQREIEWTHLYILDPNGCPSSRVQFDTNPDIATHWIAVEIPLIDEETPQNVEIREGQRFYIDPDERFLVIELAHHYSSIDGPANGEKPHVMYEFYIPAAK
jgi:hypothetical protein